jgi:hypothetical protein
MITLNYNHTVNAFGTQYEEGGDGSYIDWLILHFWDELFYGIRSIFILMSDIYHMICSKAQC